MTDIEIARMIADLVYDIYHGQVYTLDALDRVIELGEAAKKFKEGN